MAVKTLTRTSEYHDSVSLMLVARELSHFPGIADAAVVMGTEANKGILREAGMLTPEAEAATANDLVIAVRSAEAQDDTLDEALTEAGKLLRKKDGGGEAAGTSGYAEFRPKTLRGAVKSNPRANVAVISVAGRYAADEAWDALHQGLHVLLFSDNVSLADEIALKDYASKNGLLMMGPGAGTAILNGAALGFANVVPPGPVGIASAAGTGLQEVCSILARNGVGITQGIGTGGRDLKEEVGGTMMLSSLQALQRDPATQVILLISKPPAPSVAQKILDTARRSEKPTVICLLGAELSVFTSEPANVHIVPTLEEAALLAARLAGASIPEPQKIKQEEDRQLSETAAALRQRLKPPQRYLRGLFSGGTLCYEAQVIWRDLLTEPVSSNAPLDDTRLLPDSNRSVRHTAVDLGEEEFTVGRLHPMIDNDLRIRRLLQEGRDPETAVILLDVVIGYGAHPDPASELAAAVRKAQELAAEDGRELVFAASVTGTEADPQRLSRQVQALEGAGVIVCSSNAAAARLVARILER